MSGRKKDVIGFRFGRLVVVADIEPILSGVQRQRAVRCECDCGALGEYRLCSLRSGNTTSCGCFARESTSTRSRLAFRTHGGTGTPEYSAWASLLQRCRNSNDSAYQNYGGRGIRVCDRWQESFSYFLDDMGYRPSAKHSIDRMDNNGDYSPENCRWATRSEQMRNTSVNRMVSHDGETLCVTEWAERYGMCASKLNGRLNLGWSFERAVSSEKHRGDDRAFYRTPIKDRDAAWYREYELREL
jgi:hypothetical protein